MAEEKSRQEQPQADSKDQTVEGSEPLSSAVKNLVENAINEARAASSEQSVTFIEIEEEPVAEREFPLRGTAEFAANNFRFTAGATLNAAADLTKGALNMAIASAGAALSLAGAAADYIQEEDVRERSAVLLGDAEAEGQQAVKNVSEILLSFLGRR